MKEFQNYYKVAIDLGLSPCFTGNRNGLQTRTLLDSITVRCHDFGVTSTNGASVAKRHYLKIFLGASPLGTEPFGFSGKRITHHNLQNQIRELFLNLIMHHFQRVVEQH